MKIKQASIYTFLGLLLSAFLFSQNNPKIDSLLKVYESSTADSNKVKALNELFAAYRATDEEMAIKYVNLAVSFGAKTNFTNGYASALYNKGQFEGRHGNFDTSDYYIDLALSQYKKTNNKTGIASCNMVYGLNMYDKGNHKEAVAFFLESLKYREQVNDKKGISNCYTWLGNVYNIGLAQPKQALSYYEKALTIQQETNDEKGLSFTYNNIGNVHFFQKEYEPALKNYLKAIELKEKLHDLKGLSSTYNNLGSVYASLKQFEKAIEYYNKSLTIYSDFGDQTGVISNYINIGNVYFDQKKYDSAIEPLTKALEESKALGYKEGMREASFALSMNYEELHNLPKALELYKYSSVINDSINNSDFSAQVVEMQTKYDVEKKDLEIAKNKAELETKEKQAFIKNIIIGSVIVLLIMLSVSGFLFYRKKQVEQQAKLDAEIALQKEIRTKAILDAEEKERRRIAQDLHDGVGQLLSAAKMNLSNLDSKLKPETEEQKSAMQNALSLVDDSVKEVRAVSHNMMPNTLIKLGLASAIREFISKLGNAPTLKVDLEIVGLDNRLDNQVETVLYRVIQEVVNNIIKHAQASQISMQLIRHETELSVMIEDNGVGFDVKLLEQFDGIGLKGIQTRIDFLGGNVHFDSAVGRGTTVIIDVPIT